MSHFVKQCECGQIITQCRCIGPKAVEIVSPCTHKKKDQLITEYRLVCKECGDKAATFSIDVPYDMNLVLDCFMRQFNEIMLPAHKGHDFKLIDMRVHTDMPGVA